jgi:Spy/CpxP family protein refolding chaperone
MKRIFVATALLLAASGAAAAADMPSETGATSVAEMLQRKQEHQLCDQLAREGRWDEIRQIDEEQTKRLREQQEKRYVTVNETLSRSNYVAGPGNETLVNECNRESMRLRKLKSESTH